MLDASSSVVAEVEISGDKWTVDVPREDEPRASEWVTAGASPDRPACSVCSHTRSALSMCSPESRDSEMSLLYKVRGEI